MFKFVIFFKFKSGEKSVETTVELYTVFRPLSVSICFRRFRSGNINHKDGLWTRKSRKHDEKVSIVMIDKYEFVKILADAKSLWVEDNIVRRHLRSSLAWIEEIRKGVPHKLTDAPKSATVIAA